MATVCKTVGRNPYTGSNPVLPTIFEANAHVAQSVEHILGKNEVNSSILFMGSILRPAGFAIILSVAGSITPI